jgi:hypothetical protein
MHTTLLGGGSGGCAGARWGEGKGGCRWQLGNARRGTNRALPDGSAVDSIIDEPLVQSGEYLVDGSAWCELGNKERYKKYSEDPHGD